MKKWIAVLGLLLLSFESFASAPDPLASISLIDLFPKYTRDGCQERAALLSLELVQAGIPSAILTLEAKSTKDRISSPDGKTNWWMHAVVLLAFNRERDQWVSVPEDQFLHRPEAAVDYFVIDSLFGKKLLRLEDWLREVKVSDINKFDLNIKHLDLQDQYLKLSFENNCNSLLRHFLSADADLNAIYASRINFASAVNRISKQIIPTFECGSDNIKNAKMIDMSKLQWKKGTKLHALLDLDKSDACFTQLKRNGEEFYVKERLLQAKTHPECYRYEGDLEIDSVTYSFSSGTKSSAEDYFEAKGQINIPSQGVHVKLRLIINKNSSIISGKISLSSGFMILGHVDSIEVSSRPPYNLEYFNGSNRDLGLGNLAPFWFSGIENLDTKVVSQMVFFP